MKNMSKKQMAGFCVAGAIVGAVAALLYAPKTGAQTRKDIRRFSRRTVNQLDGLQQDLRGQMSEGYRQVMDALDNVKDYVEHGKTRLKGMMKSA